MELLWLSGTETMRRLGINYTYLRQLREAGRFLTRTNALAWYEYEATSVAQEAARLARAREAREARLARRRTAEADAATARATSAARDAAQRRGA